VVIRNACVAALGKHAREFELSRKTLIAAAALAAIQAGPAAAQETFCQEQVERVSAEYREMLEDRAYASARTVFRDLHSAAARLMTQEMSMDEACLETAEAMEAALAAYRAAGPDEGAGIAASPELGDIEERAVPLAEAEIDTSAIEGADLYNYDNDYLGEVSGMRVGAGRPTHVLVGEGSFWDVGPKQAAIPVDMLRWDPEWEAFFVPITSEALQEAPAYSASGDSWTPGENDRYFESLTR
jgi:hypothetical protein